MWEKVRLTIVAEVQLFATIPRRYQGVVAKVGFWLSMARGSVLLFGNNNTQPQQSFIQQVRLCTARELYVLVFGEPTKQLLHEDAPLPASKLSTDSAQLNSVENSHLIFFTRHLSHATTVFCAPSRRLARRWRSRLDSFPGVNGLAGIPEPGYRQMRLNSSDTIRSMKLYSTKPVSGNIVRIRVSKYASSERGAR